MNNLRKGDYDRMLDDVKKKLKENRKALRLPCQRD